MVASLTGPGTTGSAADFLPSSRSRSLPQLAEAAQSCRGCDLYKRATQAVFGEGPKGAHVMMVGEQPGDQEDLQGHPFVGPAGQLLDRALAEAGIDRGDVYITNAVKHFKWTLRGKRRIHAKPTAAEVRACRPWLDEEIAAVKPRVIVCLGATAAQSLMGASFRVSTQRGQVFDSGRGPRLMATVHPSSILRAPDEADRQRAYAQFVADLSLIPAELEHPSPTPSPAGSASPARPRSSRSKRTGPEPGSLFQS